MPKIDSQVLCFMDSRRFFMLAVVQFAQVKLVMHYITGLDKSVLVLHTQFTYLHS